ncbi:MAG TPA: Hsp20/alpha crystallin family protein [Acidobacteriota bacterium]
MTQLMLRNPFRSSLTPSGFFDGFLEPRPEWFDRFFDARVDAELPARSWSPAVDVIEEQDHYELQAELPGMSEKDFEVKVEDGMLSIHGERKFEKESKNGGVRRLERSYGSFTRSFGLPDNIDRDHIEAHYDKGVLKLVLPKSKESRSHSIQVKTH